jgi:hypothetical protein
MNERLDGKSQYTGGEPIKILLEAAFQRFGGGALREKRSG